MSKKSKKRKHKRSSSCSDEEGSEKKVRQPLKLLLMFTFLLQIIPVIFLYFFCGMVKERFQNTAHLRAFIKILAQKVETQKPLITNDN